MRAANATMLIAFGAGLLTGCAVGPDFQRPRPQPGDGVLAGAPPPGVEIGGRVADDWYRLFGSPALNQLVRQALRDNPDLTAARAAIGVAQYQLAQTRGAALPQVNGRLLANRARVNNGALTGNPRAGAGINNLAAGVLTLSYDLDPFGKLTRELESQRAAVDYARDQALNVYITLVDQVVRAAFQLAAADARIDATRKLLADERRQFELTRLKERAGSVPRAATLTAQAQLEGTAATLPGLEQQRDAAALALAALVGRTPATFTAPPVTLADFSTPRTVPLSLPAQLVEQRPDVLAAEAELHQASARIGIAAAQRLPDLNLSAAYGGLSGDPAALFDAGNALWAITGQLTAPIFRGGSLAAQEDQAKTQYLEAAARYRSTVLKAFSEVARALRALTHADATLTARRRALATAEQALQLSRLQFQVGTVDELQVLTAQREYRRERLAVIDAQAQRFADTATLFRALGGGWWNATRDPVPPVTAANYPHGRAAPAAPASTPTENTDGH